VQFTVKDVSKREPAADGHIVVQVDVAYAQPSHRASVVVHWRAMGDDVGTQQKVFKGPGHFTAEFVYDYSACGDPDPDGLPRSAYVEVSSSNPDVGIPAQEVEMPGYLCNG
jgi:hypothetical protein